MGGGRIPGPVCSTKISWFDTNAFSGLSGRGAFAQPLGFSLPAAPAVAASAERVPTNLDFLFLQCRNPVLGLSQQDYEDAATQLAAEINAIKAVAQVETMGNAFDNLGRPTILFERHHFHRHTGGKYDVSNPVVSAETSGGYGKFSTQYTKLEEAYRLDADAALKSASWGRFQIMGSNHVASGFTSVRGFVWAMVRKESEHLKAFVNFVEGNKRRAKALRDKDWATFAKLYNGAGYAKKGYDKNMKTAYDGLVAAEAAEAAEAKKKAP
jgi:hypothetical protein